MNRIKIGRGNSLKNKREFKKVMDLVSERINLPVVYHGNEGREVHKAIYGNRVKYHMGNNEYAHTTFNKRDKELFPRYIVMKWSIVNEHDRSGAERIETMLHEVAHVYINGKMGLLRSELSELYAEYVAVKLMRRFGYEYNNLAYLSHYMSLAKDEFDQEYANGVVNKIADRLSDVFKYVEVE